MNAFLYGRQFVELLDGKKKLLPFSPLAAQLEALRYLLLNTQHHVCRVDIAQHSPPCFATTGWNLQTFWLHAEIKTIKNQRR